MHTNYRFVWEDLQIAFNTRFLIEMPNAADTDVIKMVIYCNQSWFEQTNRTSKSEDILMLVMPLMLNN